MLHTKLLAGGVAALASAAIVIGAVAPAHADPVRPYAAGGSDTIQDVWNGLTNDAGPLTSIASYDAFDASGVASNTIMIKSKTAGIWFRRPSGSGEGTGAVSAAWNSADHLFKGFTLTHEEIDFGRSSSGPAATGTDLNYMPFARDAVSIAYNTTGTLSGLNLTTNQLIELYTGVDDTANSVVTFDGSGMPLVNGVAVHPKLPQQSSGTRKFFVAALGLPATGGFASYVSDPATGGLAENSGASIPNDGDLIPFSAAQWIAQNNGVSNNTTTGLALANINGLAPTTGTSPSMAPGALFGSKIGSNYTTVPAGGVGVFNRDTYDVIPALFRGGSATAKQSNLVSLLTTGLNAGTAPSIIRQYGFGTLSYVTDASKIKNAAFANTH